MKKTIVANGKLSKFSIFFKFLIDLHFVSGIEHFNISGMIIKVLKNDCYACATWIALLTNLTKYIRRLGISLGENVIRDEKFF